MRQAASDFSVEMSSPKFTLQCLTGLGRQYVGRVLTVFSSLQLLSRLTERFVQGVDMFVETLWKLWMELLEVLGLDGRYGDGHMCVCFGVQSHCVVNLPAPD